MFKLFFYYEISAIILSQESPSFLEKEEQVVGVGMNSRQLELCYFRFDGGCQIRLNSVIKIGN